MICVSTDNNLVESDSIRMGTNFKLPIPIIFEWDVVDHLNGREKDILLSNMMLDDTLEDVKAGRLLWWKQVLIMIIMTNDIGEIIQVRYNLLIDSKEKESHANC